MDKISAQKDAESTDMADAIADNLQDAGFDRADVDPAVAQITIVETIAMPEPSDEVEQVNQPPNHLPHEFLPIMIAFFNIPKSYPSNNLTSF